MGVGVDSNLLIALAIDDARAPAVATGLDRWLSEDRTLNAPALMQYEVANGLAHLVAAGLLSPESVAEAWTRLSAIPIALHPISDGERVVTVARQLGRSSAYDAAFIVLAQDLDAELWTLDGPLYRNASGRGFPVHLIET